jgi:hypothetical protein
MNALMPSSGKSPSTEVVSGRDRNFTSVYITHSLIFQESLEISVGREALEESLNEEFHQIPFENHGIKRSTDLHYFISICVYVSVCKTLVK